MRKVQFAATFWTLVIAIPFTALAVFATSAITENLEAILRALLSFSNTLSVSGRGLVIEFAARWPEVAGMVIGMAVILTILIFARGGKPAEEN
ncbi:MAG: hypothetical protein A2Z49_11240 [Chloroflexi bacterium RBG_19FT_COMBO_56_12]|nr:MAG: hypothetical protein A2Z49_11240 [Chloroflexi bacterium RBG_19FT_COMBO_56_12]